MGASLGNHLILCDFCVHARLSCTSLTIRRASPIDYPSLHDSCTQGDARKVEAGVVGVRREEEVASSGPRRQRCIVGDLLTAVVAQHRVSGMRKHSPRSGLCCAGAHVPVRDLPKVVLLLLGFSPKSLGKKAESLLYALSCLPCERTAMTMAMAIVFADVGVEHNGCARIWQGLCGLLHDGGRASTMTRRERAR